MSASHREPANPHKILVLESQLHAIGFPPGRAKSRGHLSPPGNRLSHRARNPSRLLRAEAVLLRGDERLVQCGGAVEFVDVRRENPGAHVRGHGIQIVGR